MKRLHGLDIVFPILLIFILCLNYSPLSTAASEKLQIEEYLPYTVDDYFIYDFDIDDMLASEVLYDDYFVGYENVNTKYDISIISTERINIFGRSFDCWVIQNDLEMKYTLLGNGEDINKYEYKITLEAKDWCCKDSFAVMKSEAEYNIRVEEDYPPDSYFYTSYIYEAEMIDRYSYTKVEDKPPFPLKVGKTWSNQKAYTINSTIKSRFKIDNNAYSGWETEYEEADFSETIMYEVISENENVVPVGTFETLKIKQQLKGESDYSFLFFDKYGMKIEEHMYDDRGTLSEIIQLTDFAYFQAKDSDGDGHLDKDDDFPYDPDEYMDSDDDGVGDNSDAFPDDPFETKDKDGDGVGDNADDFPNNPDETLDSDGDGVGDNSDAFPKDPLESKDSDSDGVGDNVDAFPFNANETKDSDRDMVGDNADAFPYNPLEIKDTDSDGIGDNADAFPDDPAASFDSDSDGYPDGWNTGKTRADSTTDLELDEYPFDGTKWEREPESSSLVAVLIIISLLILGATIIAAFILIQKRKPAEDTSPTHPYYTQQLPQQTIPPPITQLYYQYPQQPQLQQPPMQPQYQYQQQSYNYYQPGDEQ